MSPVPGSRSQLSHTTVFFRNQAQLEELAGALLPSVWTAPARLRALVCGGSTGCEAFSLLVAMREYGADGLTAQALSVDLGEGVTAHARAAAYPPETFEPLFGMEGGMPEAVRSRWFEPTEDGAAWRPIAALRADATFEALDLYDLSPEAPYDLIFCQNVLTHFEPEAAARLLDRLLEFAAPRAVIVCSGVDLDLKSRIAHAGFRPWLGRLDKIHDSFASHRMHYRENRGQHYFELEDIDRSRPDWEVRYSTLFYRGEVPASSSGGSGGGSRRPGAMAEPGGIAA